MLNTNKMKTKTIAIFATALLCTGSFKAKCQWTTSGNNIYATNFSNFVGVGTPTPAAKFVVSNWGYGGLELSPTGGLGGGSAIGAYDRSANAYEDITLYAKSYHFWTSESNSELMTFKNSNVGIGTATPAAKLDVAGNIYSSGKVMIGVTNPSAPLLNNYSLAVNGSALFTKAVVKLNSGWPDYVFSKNYELPTLASIEKYINENSHLPGVASAKEVEKNGVDLGDNQAVLLKKVEELTLYMIDMDKKMQQVLKENEEMKKKIEILSSK
jgi:hypothetical protein